MWWPIFVLNKSGNQYTNGKCDLNTAKFKIQNDFENNFYSILSLHISKIFLSFFSSQKKRALQSSTESLSMTFLNYRVITTYILC